jgi:hypothetical protein
MRSAPLTTLKGGIDRRRTKGGARADTLYDLLNGYVTDDGTAVVRPGTRRIAKLSPATRGLCAFDGVLHTFCHRAVFVPDGFLVNILAHPGVPDDYFEDEVTDGSEFALEKIHFAQPFMGALYVVAEFSNGDIYHYWLQSGDPWEANKVYNAGDLVTPVSPNGVVYRATRLGNAYPSWVANQSRSDGTDGYDVSVIEPTTYNGFYYTCVAATGTDPRSGATEPTWPEEDGAQITETVDNEDYSAFATITAPPSADQPPDTTRDRYRR